MFTGIVQARGEILRIDDIDGDKRVLIQIPDLSFDGLTLGDSIAVNGVCLTATEFVDHGFWADVSLETINCTTFKFLEVGSIVNIEKSLTPQTSLGGHLVSGHVDGVGEVLEITREARSMRFIFRTPESIAKYIAAKGSICIDGTSLTVNNVDSNEFDVNIILHTFENTLFSEYREGSQVNLEVDIIARYVERIASFKLA